MAEHKLQPIAPAPSANPPPPPVSQPQASTSSASPSAPAAPSAAQDSQAGPVKKKNAAKLFRCNGFGDCQMTFTRSEHLARHVRKHTGERPFKCHCGRTFSRLDNVRQHAATVHADLGDRNANTIAELVALHNSLSAATMQRQRDSGMIVQDPNAEPRPRKKAAATGENGEKKKAAPKKKSAATEKKAKMQADQAAADEQQRLQQQQQPPQVGQGGFAAPAPGPHQPPMPAAVPPYPYAAQFAGGYPGAVPPQYAVPPPYGAPNPYGAYPGMPPQYAAAYAGMGMYGAPAPPPQLDIFSYAQQPHPAAATVSPPPPPGVAAFYPQQHQPQHNERAHRPPPLSTASTARPTDYPSPHPHSASLPNGAQQNQHDGPLTPNKISLPGIHALLDGQPEQQQQQPQQQQQAQQQQAYYSGVAASQSRPPSTLGMPPTSAAPASTSAYAASPYGNGGNELQQQQQNGSGGGPHGGLYPPTIPSDPYHRPGSTNPSERDHTGGGGGEQSNYSHLYQPQQPPPSSLNPSPYGFGAPPPASLQPQAHQPPPPPPSSAAQYPYSSYAPPPPASHQQQHQPSMAAAMYGYSTTPQPASYPPTAAEMRSWQQQQQMQQAKMHHHHQAGYALPTPPKLEGGGWAPPAPGPGEGEAVGAR